MEIQIGAIEAGQQFERVLESVADRGDSYVVEYRGEPVAAVVPLKLYEQWKRDRDAFFDELEDMARQADLSPAEADALALESVEATRRAKR